MSLLITLHLLSAVIWVGGMFFAYMALRPVAASLLEPPLRLSLWAQVFSKFFPWVWLAIIILLCSGLGMIFGVMGGMANARPHVHLMLLLGIIMMLIFMHVYFAPFRRLKQAVAEKNWPLGGEKLTQIRKLILVNLCLGLIVVIVASVGRYF